MSTTTKPTILLVHGGWHTSSCFDLIRSELHGRGWETAVVELPSMSGARVESNKPDVEAVREKLASLKESGKEIILVGHSYSGTIITEASPGFEVVAGQPGGIVRLIYIAAVVPKPGETMGQHIAGVDPSLMGMATEDGFASLPDKEKAIQFFYPDLEPEEAAKRFDQLVKFCMAPLATPIEKTGYTSIPSAYLACKKDAIPVAYQQGMVIAANQIGGRFDYEVTLDSGHFPFLSKVKETADFIEASYDKLGKA